MKVYQGKKTTSAGTPEVDLIVALVMNLKIIIKKGIGIRRNRHQI